MTDHIAANLLVPASAIEELRERLEEGSLRVEKASPPAESRFLQKITMGLAACRQRRR